VPPAELVQTFGPYCVVSPELVDDYLGRFDRATEICHALGGRQYLYGYNVATSDFYRRQFGHDTLASWRSLKRRYDPGDILGPVLFE
jgi:hypothetical protein